MREGAVYKTKRLGTQWFRNDEASRVNVIIHDKDNDVRFTWANTTDAHFGPTKPLH